MLFFGKGYIRYNNLLSLSNRLALSRRHSLTPGKAHSLGHEILVPSRSDRSAESVWEPVSRRSGRHLPRIRRGKKRGIAEPYVRRASSRGGAAGRRERRASGRARAATFSGWRRSGVQLRDVTPKVPLGVERSWILMLRRCGPPPAVRAAAFSHLGASAPGRVIEPSGSESG